jgi:hypothetical protein
MLSTAPIGLPGMPLSLVARRGGTYVLARALGPGPASGRLMAAA